MTHIVRILIILVTTFVMLLNIAPSWGQPVCAASGCNPTVSDANGHTARGTVALADDNQTGAGNTAFGGGALTLVRLRVLTLNLYGLRYPSKQGSTSDESDCAGRLNAAAQRIRSADPPYDIVGIQELYSLPGTI